LEPRLEGVQLQLGDQPLQTQEESPIGSSRIVDAILVADEAVAEAAQVQELIPVRAVACQARGVIREDDADLAQGHTADQFGEADPGPGGPRGLAEVCVDDIDRGLGPAAGEGPLAEVILESETLLMAGHLLRGGLADVDHSSSVAVAGSDEFGADHGG